MASPSLEERVAYLEGKVEEHSRGYAQIRDDIQQLRQYVLHLDQRLSARMDALDQKVDRVREELSGRMDALDRKVDRFREELSGRIQAADQRLSARMDALDQKFSRWFAWLTGILLTTAVAMLGIVAAALLRR